MKHPTHLFQRFIALATVLAMQPEILLLDEPTNSLDEQSAQRLLETLDSLTQAMILVSHDREFREKLTDQVFLLNQGHLEEVANH